MTEEAKRRADIVGEHLEEFGGTMTQKEIAEGYGFARSSVSETAKMLREQGQVTVTGQTPDDLTEDPMESIEALLKRQERSERLAKLKKDQVVEGSGSSYRLG
jgi:Mn-dependent DtxR family transcriptional regulator